MSHEKERQQYERDAMYFPDPFTCWQARLAGTEMEWLDLDSEPHWCDDCEYRRKPACAMGHEFPPPEVAVPVRGKPVFITDPMEDEGYWEVVWTATPLQAKFLYRGLVHFSPEDAKAHAQAMVYASRGAF